MRRSAAFCVLLIAFIGGIGAMRLEAAAEFEHNPLTWQHSDKGDQQGRQLFSRDDIESLQSINLGYAPANNGTSMSLFDNLFALLQQTVLIKQNAADSEPAPRTYNRDSDDDDDDDPMGDSTQIGWRPDSIQDEETMAEAMDMGVQEYIEGMAAYEPYRAVLHPEVQYIHHPHTWRVGLPSTIDLLVSEAMSRLRARSADVMGVEYDISDFREAGLHIIRMQEIQRIRAAGQMQKHVIEDVYWVHVDLYEDEKYDGLPSSQRPREWRIRKIELVQTLVDPIRFNQLRN